MMSLRPWWWKDQNEAKAWEPMLNLCSTGMVMVCMIIGLLGGAAGLGLMLHVANKSPLGTEPLSVEDGVGILSGFFLCSTFLPMGIALGVGKAILVKMEEDQKK